MTCNVTSARAHWNQLLATLGDTGDPTRVIALQEHSCPESGLEPLRRTAGAKRLQAVLGPADPDASRAAAGV
eukprot:7821156-Alexandrium_andersonii.AAC.1